MTAYLTDKERRDLQGIVIALTGGDYHEYRPALLAGLPPRFAATFGQARAASVQLSTDLKKLNGTMKVADGLVPLVSFLEELVSQFAADDQALVGRARDLLAKIERASSGAPEVAPPTPDEVKEAIVHQNDLLPASFMRGAQTASAAVAKLEVPRILDDVEAKAADGSPQLFLGTGWMIGPKLLLTNHHVINARFKGETVAKASDLDRQVGGMKVLFDYDDEHALPVRLGVTGLVDADPLLDFALLRIDTDRAPVALSLDLPVAPDGHSAPALNIIQHPGGDPKAFGIRNNLMASSSDTDLRYFTDTKGGSSGAPVFDDQWQAVALHRGHSYAPGVSFQGLDASYINVGTRLSAIIDHLRAKFRGQLPELGI